MNWCLFALKRSFNFTDRARRREYAWFYLVNLIISFILGILAGVAISLGLENIAYGFDILFTIYQILIFLAATSLTTRRLHDLGWSGWWQLGLYLLTILLVLVSIFALDQEMSGAITVGEWAVYIATLIMLLVIVGFSLLLLFKDGQRFTNKYGEDPKAVKNDSEVANSLAV
ncbi:DUF805 domain-containing protein [Actinobacillus equuli]|uniref:DUF805 domain-containing protein n=1 Tax=Actinobacillus equuli TaxID=718 RepID=UPI0024434811|nr:DUF805 domain-containing protein [Actinobacillus equuli]WGE64619.1 DUF805 domain-containing protein [Actinobacillus equuli subsp. equuli]WGE78580.1 DUF805 domain-containing protein [Actinobacillus equuli subsp. equuli]